jgi:hypothetical protein
MKLRVVAVAAALSTLVVGPGSHGQGIGRAMNGADIFILRAFRKQPPTYRC